MRLSKVLLKSIVFSATKTAAQETLYEVTGCNNENSSVSANINFLTAKDNKMEINLFYE